jgi:hypothetical protein
VEAEYVMNVKRIRNIFFALSFMLIVLAISPIQAAQMTLLTYVLLRKSRTVASKKVPA